MVQVTSFEGQLRHAGMKVTFASGGAFVDASIAAPIWHMALGEGIYASQRDPTEFGSPEAVLYNNYMKSILKNPSRKEERRPCLAWHSSRAVVAQHGTVSHYITTRSFT